MYLVAEEWDLGTIKDLFFQSKEKPQISIVDYLSYREFRSEEKLFILSDNSLGVIYKLPLIEHEPLSVNDISDFRSQLEQWLNLPPECTAQFLFQQSEITAEEIKDKLDLGYQPENQVARFLRDERIKAFESRAAGAVNLFSRACYFSIRYTPNSGAFNINDLLTESLADSVSSGFHQFERKVEDFERILSRLESLSRIRLERIDASELRKIIQTALCDQPQQVALINDCVPLNEQLLFQTLEADPSGLVGGKFTKTVSLLVPSGHYEGASSLFLKLNFPFLLSLRLTFPSKAKVNKFLAVKEWCTKNSFSPKSQKQFEDIQSTKKRIAEGDPCIHMCWSVTVEGESEKEVFERANKVAAFAVEAFDCNAIIESEIGFDLLRNSLPLHYDPSSERGTQRHIPLHRSEIINFLPIFDSFRGTKKPLQVFRSREGNLVPFSAVEGETCQHALFLGDSGSGKSALINSVINGLKALNPEPILFVIDFNTSQVMNVKYYGGELNIFSQEQNCPASVFRGLYDQKKVSILTNWIAEAVRLTSPSFIIESEHREAIAQAVKLAYKKKALASGIKFIEGDLFEFESVEAVSIDMDAIATELSYLPGEKGFEKFRKAVEELLVKLRNFYGDGLYASYFRPAEKSLRYDKRFYVYDLANIQSDPVLLNLTIASIFEEIRQVKMLPENQGREIWTILDEIAVLGRESSLLTQYFVNKAETSRKDAFWIIGATNRPQNFVEIPVCLALLQVAVHLFFLPMDRDNVHLFAKHTDKLTEADQENVISLRIKKGQFSEALYINKSTGTKGVLVYEQIPHERWQSPTNAKEGREALKALKKFADNAVAAIDYLVKQFPQGVS